MSAHHHDEPEDIDRRTLIGAIKRWAYREAPPGEPFTLASGKTSNYFIDMKQLLMRHEQLGFVTHMISELLNEDDYFDVYDGIAGVALGGCSLATALALHEKVPVLFVRREAKDHGTQQLVEGPISGDDRVYEVVLVEDVVTTGQSSLRAVEALKAVGVEVSLVVAVVDREEGARKAFREAKVPFRALVKLSDFRPSEPETVEP